MEPNKTEYNEDFIKNVNFLLSNSNLDSDENQSVMKFANELVDNILVESFKQLERKVFLKEKSILLKKMLPMTRLAEVNNHSTLEMASNLIDGILKESSRRVDNNNLIGVERIQRYKSPEEFSINDGLELILRCISKWTLNPNWHFKIKYNGTLVNESHSHFYTLKLSVPTPSYPIAQVTADIYFTLEITAMNPPPIFIEMWYRLESNRSQHNAFTTTFKESLLRTLIKQKLQAFKLFHF